MTEKPLLVPLTADEWSDDEYAAVGALMGIPGEDVPRAGSGHARDPMNFDIIGALVRHPKMAPSLSELQRLSVAAGRAASAAA